MERVNIYGFPHKGLRNALGQLSFKLGNISLGSKESIAKAVEVAEEISELLKLHLHSEETHVLPPLEVKVPGSTQHNHDDHEAMEQLENDMLNKVHKLKEEPTISNATVAYNSVNMFIREYFRHMDEEEFDMNKVIWENFQDQEILEWQGKILSELTPEQFFKWFKYIIPSLMPHEQTIMLSGFKANAPAEAYRNTIEGLKPYLTSNQFNHIQSI